MSSAVKIAPASLFLVESPIDRCQEVKSRIPLLVVIVESGCILRSLISCQVRAQPMPSELSSRASRSDPPAARLLHTQRKVQCPHFTLDFAWILISLQYLARVISEIRDKIESRDEITISQICLVMLNYCRRCGCPFKVVL